MGPRSLAESALAHAHADGPLGDLMHDGGCHSRHAAETLKVHKEVVISSADEALKLDKDIVLRTVRADGCSCQFDTEASQAGRGPCPRSSLSCRCWRTERTSQLADSKVRPPFQESSLSQTPLAGQITHGMVRDTSWESSPPAEHT